MSNRFKAVGLFCRALWGESSLPCRPILQFFSENFNFFLLFSECFQFPRSQFPVGCGDFLFFPAVFILFLCTEAGENKHILLQRGMYLSQKWSTAPFCQPVHRAARPYGLCVLYDTAARVSEICNLRIEDVRFESPPHIRIMGKGMKVRAVPILPATAKNEKNPQAMGNWLRGN